jgi:predicted flap endonuclease-1-like 5' DNA nuclease
MILHIGEVWLLLAVAFTFGGLLGSLVFRTLALSSARPLQAWLIRGIDGGVARIERKLFPGRTIDFYAPTAVPENVPLAVPIPTEMFLEPGAVEKPLEPLVIEHEPTPPPSAAGLEPRRRSKKFYEALARADLVGIRPLPLQAPRRGSADNLAVIRKLGKRNATRLSDIGIFHFSQIASWTPQETAWIAAFLGVDGTPWTEDWSGQALQLATLAAFPGSPAPR